MTAKLGSKENPFGKQGEYLGLTKAEAKACPGLQPGAWYIIHIEEPRELQTRRRDSLEKVGWIIVDGIGGPFPLSNFQTITKKDPIPEKAIPESVCGIWEHLHINRFKENHLDQGRDNILLRNYPVNGNHVHSVICLVFDEALQENVEVSVFWAKIIDFFERRRKLDLELATIIMVRFVGPELEDIEPGLSRYALATAMTTWNGFREVWELNKILVGNMPVIEVVEADIKQA